MSTTVTLYIQKWHNGKLLKREVWSESITYNLTKLAKEYGVYEAIYRPYMLLPSYNLRNKDDMKCNREFEKNNKITASEIYQVLDKVSCLYNKYESDDDIIYLMEFIEEYRYNCFWFPDAIVEIS